MSQSAYLRNLISDVYAALEYMDQLGLTEVLPVIPPKKIKAPDIDFAALSFGKEDSPKSPSARAYGPAGAKSPPDPYAQGADPYAARPRTQVIREPAKKTPVQGDPPSPTALSPRSVGKALSPDEIMAQAGYEPLRPTSSRTYDKAPPVGRGAPAPESTSYPDAYPDYPDSRGGYPGEAQSGYPRSSVSKPRPTAKATGTATAPPPAKAKVYGRVCKEPPKISSVDTSWIEGAKTIEELNRALESCKNCSLCQENKGVIPGRGPSGAPIVFVFDPPSYDSIPSRTIPVGPELEFFETVITKGLKLKPEDVYVTPISKCPLPDPANYAETFPMKACVNTLFREIELVGPKAVVALGETPATHLTGTQMRFAFQRQSKWVIGRGQKVPLKVTFDLPTVMELIEIKREFWSDLKEVIAFITDD